MCPLCNMAEDTQEHCLKCPTITKEFENEVSKVTYSDIFEGFHKQEIITEVYHKILTYRKTFLDERADPPGLSTGP